MIVKKKKKQKAINKKKERVVYKGDGKMSFFVKALYSLLKSYGAIPFRLEMI